MPDSQLENDPKIKPDQTQPLAIACCAAESVAVSPLSRPRSPCVRRSLGRDASGAYKTESVFSPSPRLTPASSPPSAATSPPQTCPHRRNQTPRRPPRLHRVRPRCCAVAPKIPSTAPSGFCLDRTQEARQARRESGLAVGAAAHTNLNMRAVTTQFGGEVGAVEVAHTLRVGLLGRGA
eukprot:scaffold31954_cov66-Phaeocystis_antarctica.AAC.3